MFLKAMGAMPGYIYATDENSVYVNLFVGSKASMRMNGSAVSVRQSTRYPWNGNVKIEVEPSQPATFALMVRIPGWCTGETVKVNGQRVDSGNRTRGYLRIQRDWHASDVVELEMPMPARQMRSNPLVQANAGRTAIVRGPLVYCLESADNHESVRLLSLPHESRFSAEVHEDLPDGVVALKTTGVTSSNKSGGLYFASDTKPAARPSVITAIPYYANANRGPVEMVVWIPLET